MMTGIDVYGQRVVSHRDEDYRRFADGAKVGRIVSLKED